MGWIVMARMLIVVEEPANRDTLAAIIRRTGHEVRMAASARRLRAFRAGIEGVISFLKRGFGLGRCLWRGLRSFQAYVQASVLACNLLVVARHALAAAKPD
jgi:hypothetical protein